MTHSLVAAGVGLPTDEELPAVDLSTLLSEMARLRAAVRADAVAARELRDRFEAAAVALETRAREETGRARRAWIDLADRLEAALDCAQTLTKPRRWWQRPAPPGGLEMAAGLTLTVARVRERLADLGVERMLALGRTFDPLHMEAVGSTWIADQPEATVIDEVTAGYRAADGPIRMAQVIVNRRS